MGRRIRPDCVVCGKALTPGQKECCSTACQYKHNSGAKHHSWKGGSVRSDGYIAVYVGGKLMLQHRHVMEVHLGRPLLQAEVVHHKDGNIQNNTIENLEVIPSQSAHMAEHRQSFASLTHRECTLCREIKPRTEFYPNRKASGGRDPHHPHCRKCQLEQKHQEYLANPEKGRARARALRQKRAADQNNAHMHLPNFPT